MFSSTAAKPDNFSDSQEAPRDAGRLFFRKIWLPKAIYAGLPYFYVIAGVAALFATAYIGQWFWVLPHYLLFSAACLHLGILVYRRRHRHSGEE
jgi:hypothetical protein